MCKVEASPYTPQLKRDYIPGCGDCVDMVCFACGWDKERAWELGGKDLLVRLH